MSSINLPLIIWYNGILQLYLGMKKMTILDKVAKRIKELRKMKHLSQELLAEKADLHPSLIGKMERSEINPTIASLEKISKAFNISLSEFFAFPGEKEISDVDVQILDKAVDILEQALDQAKRIKKEFK